MAEPAPEGKKRRRRWPFFVLFFLVALIAIGPKELRDVLRMVEQ